jgi:hypothetical protein
VNPRATTILVTAATLIAMIGAACRTEFPTASTMPPFRYVPMKDGGTYMVRTKFNEAPTVITLPSPEIKRITCENVTMVPDKTNAGFLLVRNPNTDYLTITALSQNQTGKIIVKYQGEIHTVVLDEVSRFHQYDPRQIKPDRTVVLFRDDENPPPKNFLMNPLTTYDIPLRCGFPPISVSFPSPNITKITGVNVNLDPTKTDADFLVTFKPGDNHFLLHPLRQHAQASINVLYGRETYVIALHETSAIKDAVPNRTIIFKHISR